MLMYIMYIRAEFTNHMGFLTKVYSNSDLGMIYLIIEHKCVDGNNRFKKNMTRKLIEEGFRQ